MNFVNIQKIVPKNFIYDFMWMGEYQNGNLITEYNAEKNPQVNNFYMINRQDLLKFGYVGHGMKIYFNTYDGVFNINNDIYDILYKVNGQEYSLTKQLGVNYNDIIQYKHCISFIDPIDTNYGTSDKEFVDSYNIGYKTKLTIGIIQFSFKVIYTMPLKGLPYLCIKIVPNQTLPNGEIIIKKNNLLNYNFKCPMKKNVGGQLHWVVR